MAKVAVFNDTRPMRHFGRDAVMADIKALMARYKLEVLQRIGAMCDRFLPTEVHRA